MPTTVVKSVGTTGRDYSTIQAAEDAKPANLVSADQVWKMECYNDSEFTAGVVISGSTVDATRYTWLTAANGQSFADHANRLTNPLKYDRNNGVGIRMTGNYDVILRMEEDYCVVSRMQFKNQGTYTNSNTSVGIANANCRFDGNLFEYTGNIAIIGAQHDSIRISNNVLVANGSNLTANALLFAGNNGAAVNNTIVRPSDRAAAGVGIALSAGYSGTLVQNNAVFNFTTAFGGTGTAHASSGYNLTDAATAFGSNNQVSKTFANQFQNATSSAQDWRIKSGADAINNATRAQTYTNDLDIVGTARSVTTPTIGAWEFGAALPVYLRMATALPNGTARKVTVWADTSYASVLYSLQNVTANGSGVLEFSAPAATVGNWYPAVVIAHGANETVSISGTGCGWMQAGN